MSFFDTLNFTSSNEDGATEVEALTRGGPPARVLCLTGSGGRPLDMLMADPGEVVALDLNPAQNALLRLKIAAFRALDDAEIPAYLGIAPAETRAALHARVLQAMDREGRVFWEPREGLALGGVWYAGRWEKVLRIGARLNGLYRGRAIARLFAAGGVGEQAAIWERQFDDGLWRGAIRLLARRWIWTRIVGEPGGAFLPSPALVEQRLAGAFRRASARFLFRDSDFASLILRGRHDAAALPLHLRPEAIAITRDRLDRIRIVTGGIGDLGQGALAGFDAFSLSDFGSYTDAAMHAALWERIAAAAAPGARYAERTFLNALPRPPHAEEDPALSAHLSERDRAIVYRVHAGRITGGRGFTG
ncbi:DUF3419 family protein [Roseicyclus sp. F158]|uniref:DUF3419 family protein n=1 Tax=Tropicimonas omnivorans TaxID=3075590 RepID=A0ABU3DC24_9RHOB|nr:DUF3419 family protein [Roseicyclus sp. F158]MDT0681260.1 DUF3419 family protein [Roseicyclus sp. F158]